MSNVLKPLSTNIVLPSRKKTLGKKTSGNGGLNKKDNEGIYTQIGNIMARRAIGQYLIDYEEKHLEKLISQSFDGKIKKKIDVTAISSKILLKNGDVKFDFTEKEQKHMLIDYYKNNGLTIKEKYKDKIIDIVHVLGAKMTYIDYILKPLVKKQSKLSIYYTAEQVKKMEKARKNKGDIKIQMGGVKPCDNNPTCGKCWQIREVPGGGIIAEVVPDGRQNRCGVEEFVDCPECRAVQNRNVRIMPPSNGGAPTIGACTGQQYLYNDANGVQRMSALVCSKSARQLDSYNSAKRTLIGITLVVAGGYGLTQGYAQYYSEVPYWRCMGAMPGFLGHTTDHCSWMTAIPWYIQKMSQMSMTVGVVLLGRELFTSGESGTEADRQLQQQQMAVIETGLGGLQNGAAALVGQLPGFEEARVVQAAANARSQRVVGSAVAGALNGGKIGGIPGAMTGALVGLGGGLVGAMGNAGAAPPGVDDYLKNKRRPARLAGHKQDFDEETDGEGIWDEITQMNEETVEDTIYEFEALMENASSNATPQWEFKLGLLRQWLSRLKEKRLKKKRLKKKRKKKKKSRRKSSNMQTSSRPQGRPRSMSAYLDPQTPPTKSDGNPVGSEAEGNTTEVQSQSDEDEDPPQTSSSTQQPASSSGPSFSFRTNSMGSPPTPTSPSSTATSLNQTSEESNAGGGRSARRRTRRRRRSKRRSKRRRKGGRKRTQNKKRKKKRRTRRRK